MTNEATFRTHKLTRINYTLLNIFIQLADNTGGNSSLLHETHPTTILQQRWQNRKRNHPPTGSCGKNPRKQLRSPHKVSTHPLHHNTRVADYTPSTNIIDFKTGATMVRTVRALSTKVRVRGTTAEAPIRQDSISRMTRIRSS